MLQTENGFSDLTTLRNVLYSKCDVVVILHRSPQSEDSENKIEGVDMRIKQIMSDVSIIERGIRESHKWRKI